MKTLNFSTLGDCIAAYNDLEKISTLTGNPVTPDPLSPDDRELDAVFIEAADICRCLVIFTNAGYQILID